MFKKFLRLKQASPDSCRPIGSPGFQVPQRIFLPPSASARPCSARRKKLLLLRRWPIVGLCEPVIGGAARICLHATKLDPVCMMADGAGLTSVEWAWLIGCCSLDLWEIWAGYASFASLLPSSSFWFLRKCYPPKQPICLVQECGERCD